MKCPRCASPDNGVTDSRETAGSESVRRRRKCMSCQHRFSTYEVSLPEGLMIERCDGVEASSQGAAGRLLQLVALLGRLAPEDARLLLVLGKKLAGEDVSAIVSLERVA